MNISDISNLNGVGFSKLMQSLKSINIFLYGKIIKRYFSEYENEIDPFISSWNDDPDEVWDAEAYIKDLYGSSTFMKKFIDEYND